MKPDQERVRQLLLETIKLLCQNSLKYSNDLRLEGVLGITIDSTDVFIVHLDEVINKCSSELAASHPSPVEGPSKLPTLVPPSTDRGACRPGLKRGGFDENVNVEHVSHPDQNCSLKLETYIVPDDDDDDDDSNNKSDGIDLWSNQRIDKQQNSVAADLNGQEAQLNVPPPVRRKRKRHSCTSEPGSTGASNFNLNDLNDSDREYKSANYSEFSDRTASNFPTGASQSHLTCQTKRVPGLADGERWNDAGGGPEMVDYAEPFSVETGQLNPNLASSQLAFSRPPIQRRSRHFPKPFICQYPDCDKTFYQTFNLYRHQRLKHGQPLNSCPAHDRTRVWLLSASNTSSQAPSA